MATESMINWDPEAPGYTIPPGSVWNDNKDRLIICFEIHGKTPPYKIELIFITTKPATGKRIVEFKDVDWPTVRTEIEKGKMQRIPSLESKFLTKTSKS